MRSFHNPCLRVVLACWLTVIAISCGQPNVNSAPDATTVEVPRPSLVAGVFPTVEPDVTEGSIPERFSRELPGSVAAFEATWSGSGEQAGYPAGHVRRGLCAGDPEILGRFERAVAAAVAAGDDPAELRATYGDLLEWCERPEQCAWATATIEAGSAASEVAWVALAHCPGDAVQALFERGGAPADTLIEYWAGRSWHEDYKPRWNAPLVAALREVATAGDVWKTRTAAVLVSEMGTDAVATLLKLYDDLPAGETRDQLASSFSKTEDPRAKKLFAEYCQKADGTDAVCQSDWSPLKGLITPGPEFEDVSPDCLGEGLETLLADGDVNAVYDASECLATLVSIERATAVAQARTVLSWDPDNERTDDLAQLVRWLDAFPEEGQLEDALRTVGLLPRGPLPGRLEWRAGPGLNPGEVLISSGPVHCFDLETDQFPNQHDRLLYDLAELAGAPLDTAVFEEEAPPFEHPGGGWVVAGRTVDAPPPGFTEGMPYRVRAYLDDRIYETHAQDFGDWYDLDRILGLLNAVASDQGAAVRVVTLPTDDQNACVLAAPKDAILAGIKAGLLQVGAGGAAERGRERERQLLGQLLEQGDIESVSLPD